MIVSLPISSITIPPKLLLPVSLHTDVTIGFEQASYTVMEGYTVEVCFNAIVQGTVTRTVMVDISTADHSAMGKRNLNY